MKVEVKDTKKEEKREYPYIGILKDDNEPLLLVLFIGKNEGISLKDGLNQAFHYSKKYDENSFMLFYGEITLSNY